MARLTRGEKLDRKGIFHWEVDDVFVRLSAKQSNLNLAYRLDPLVDAIAVLGAHIRDRMRKGVNADGSVRMRKRYPGPIGLWSGGTWKGMEARGVGGKVSAELGFAGQSAAEWGMFEDLGRGAAFKKRYAAGKVRESTQQTIRNDLKALNVWNRHGGLNMLEASQAELDAVAESIGFQVQQHVISNYGGTQGFSTGGAAGYMPGADPVLRAKLASRRRYG